MNQIKDGIQIPLQHLVLTAIGKDKTGLVSELTALVSQCKCNILDSKMAIFGSEFTMIMLIEGANTELLQLETLLPELAMKLDLLTMMKRTTHHQQRAQNLYLVELEGPDQAGTIKQITSYFTQHDIGVSSLKSKALVKDEKDWQAAEIQVNLPNSMTAEQFKEGCLAVASSLNMSCEFYPINID